jgi:hypothetical protein
VIARTILALALLASASPAAAQTSAPTVEFLPRTVFHMGAEHLSGDDPRFVWDANLGGELDLVDFGRGRVTFFGDYEVVLGEELKAFDPNQGNYILEGSLSGRLPQVELAAVFYHQSRHLSDREKTQAVDWNMVGVRASRGWIVGAMHVQGRADVRGTVQRTLVDYRWEFDGRVRADRVLRPGAGVLLGGAIRHLGVDGRQRRGDQTGFRLEGGVRFDGGAGAVELFVAGERRIDPYPLEFSTMSWVTAGFRLLSR